MKLRRFGAPGKSDPANAVLMVAGPGPRQVTPFPAQVSTKLEQTSDGASAGVNPGRRPAYNGVIVDHGTSGKENARC
jgi:hypothetical protein